MFFRALLNAIRLQLRHRCVNIKAELVWIQQLNCCSIGSVRLDGVGERIAAVA